MKEAMKRARQIIWRYRHETPLGNQPHMIAIDADEAFELIDAALAQQEPWCMKMNGCKTKCEDCPIEVVEQEPVAWKTMEAKYPSLEKLDIRMGDGSILCDVWPQSDGDFWWAGSGTGEKFIDPKYADVTHWRVHSDTTPPQPEERNFCPRCGKRTADLTVIHTCTPPQERT